MVTLRSGGVGISGAVGGTLSTSKYVHGFLRPSRQSQLGDLPVDAVAPTLSSLSPAVNSALSNSQAITFTVTDNVSMALVTLSMQLAARAEVIHDGNAFLAPYSASSTRTPVTGGYSFSIVRTGGWPSSSMTLDVRANDAAGNLVSPATYAYTVTHPTGAAGPNITMPSPTSTSTISATTPIVFNVADDSGTVVSLDIYANSELVYSAGAFSSKFVTDSTAIPGFNGNTSTNGTSFSILPRTSATPGWRTTPLTVTVVATDGDGNLTTATFTYTVTAPLGAVLPTVSNVSPAQGTVLTPTQSVSFRVSDETALLFVEVQCDQLKREVVHDGDSFLDPYLNSTKTTVDAKTFDFVVSRTNGWAAPPTFHVRVIDSNGNQAV